MSKVWYHAVCDKCKVEMKIFVSNPSCTAYYLSEYDKFVQKFLEEHHACELRLIHRDDQLDFIHNNNYTKINPAIPPDESPPENHT